MGNSTAWTPEEDLLLADLVEEHGPKRWSAISQALSTKGSKQCRRRWKNFLNVEIKKGGWTQEEDDILIREHKLHGNKWTELAKSIAGRTDNAVKNRWAALKKRQERDAGAGRKVTKAARKCTPPSSPEPDAEDNYIRRDAFANSSSPAPAPRRPGRPPLNKARLSIDIGEPAGQAPCQPSTGKKRKMSSLIDSSTLQLPEAPTRTTSSGLFSEKPDSNLEALFNGGNDQILTNNPHYGTVDCQEPNDYIESGLSPMRPVKSSQFLDPDSPSILLPCVVDPAWAPPAELQFVLLGEIVPYDPHNQRSNGPAEDGMLIPFTIPLLPELPTASMCVWVPEEKVPGLRPGQGVGPYRPKIDCANAEIAIPALKREELRAILGSLDNDPEQDFRLHGPGDRDIIMC